MLAAGLVLVFAWSGFAQTQPDGVRVSIRPRGVPRPRAAASLRVDVRLVLVPVSVTDPFGSPVPGLTSEDFRLFEDGIEQQIRHATSQEEPVSLGVVVDASQSMEDKMDRARAAVARFFRVSLPGDEFFLLEFNDRPSMMCGFTSDTELIEKALMGLRPRNRTALFDAVYMALHQARKARNRRQALLILSDGADNYSRYSEGEMMSLVREAGIGIYAIGLPGGGLLASRRHMRLLKRLSEETGGRMYEIEKIDDLPDAVAGMNNTIRNQYLLTYVSNVPTDDDRYRKIQVRLNARPEGPPLRATWRTGYYPYSSR
ncbi:MAG: VWA domain-containing protein [Bryobacteraceae bacterium]